MRPRHPRYGAGAYATRDLRPDSRHRPSRNRSRLLTSTHPSVERHRRPRGPASQWSRAAVGQRPVGVAELGRDRVDGERDEEEATPIMMVGSGRRVEGRSKAPDQRFELWQAGEGVGRLADYHRRDRRTPAGTTPPAGCGVVPRSRARICNPPRANGSWTPVSVDTKGVSSSTLSVRNRRTSRNAGRPCSMAAKWSSIENWDFRPCRLRGQRLMLTLVVADTVVSPYPLSSAGADAWSFDSRGDAGAVGDRREGHRHRLYRPGHADPRPVHRGRSVRVALPHRRARGH